MTSWRQIERDVRHLLGDSSLDVLTTVIDYYAFPLDAPAELRGDPALESALMAETSGAGGPELINEGVETAPSKRLARLCPGYTKTLDGPLVIADLGIERLRACCPHMDAWLRQLGV